MKRNIFKQSKQLFKELKNCSIEEVQEYHMKKELIEKIYYFVPLIQDQKLPIRFPFGTIEHYFKNEIIFYPKGSRNYAVYNKNKGVMLDYIPHIPKQEKFYNQQCQMIAENT